MAAAFPVTTAFELPGTVVERNLGITFGLVVRAMGFSKTVAGGISSLRQGEVSLRLLRDRQGTRRSRRLRQRGGRHAVGMSEPGGGAPAGRRSLLGDADRERLIVLLREHYAAGRLDLDDLRHRVGVVLAAAYAEEAAVALADLPPAGVSDTAAAGRVGDSRGRHAQTRKPELGWVPTAERFRDPSSGVIMRVWIDPSDESRHYVPDDAATP
jgi:hypothetical protein